MSGMLGRLSFALAVVLLATACEPRHRSTRRGKAAPPDVAAPTGKTPEAGGPGVASGPVKAPDAPDGVPAPEATGTRPAPALCDLFGMGFSGEVTGQAPQLYPHLADAGVGCVRVFPEWCGIQPAEGKWDWTASDAVVGAARENDLQVLGLFAYFAPWASSAAPGEKDWGKRTRTFPLRDMQFWRDYVKACVTRYRDDVRAWEVWNEPNAPAFNRGGSPKDYADLVREAHKAAKAVDPDVMIGITCASFDVGYLDSVIASGAAGHFDFVAVHPYNSISFLFGREPSFLGMAGNLRKMLKQRGQPEDIELWITEIGVQTTGQAKANRRQAEALAKTFILSAAQGFEKVFWFEARGPSYGPEGDFGILNADSSLRPSGRAARAISKSLAGRRYAGWLDVGGGGYGFVFDGEPGPVLAAWAPPGADAKLSLDAAVTTIDMDGNTKQIPAGGELALTTLPVIVRDPPKGLVASARGNAAKPFPWGTDYAKADEVWCKLAPANTSFGLVQKDQGDGVTVAGLVEGQEYRRTDKAKGKNYIYFDVDNTYAAFGDGEIEITVFARRPPGRDAGLKICYESAKGYREIPGWWTIPHDDRWCEKTFRVTDANFADTWGWNFRVDAVPSSSDVWVREVRVKRIGEKR